MRKSSLQLGICHHVFACVLTFCETAAILTSNQVGYLVTRCSTLQLLGVLDWTDIGFSAFEDKEHPAENDHTTPYERRPVHHLKLE